MKIQFPLIIVAALWSGATAQQALDYSATFTGSAKCALINAVMDESGSMSGDQLFLKNVAIPRMAAKLQSPEYDFDYVFLCSGGFGAVYASNPQYYRHHGCTLVDSNGVIANPAVTSWVANGAWEDGWYAIKASILNVTASIEGIDLLSSCASLARNLIFVSDEDRDNLYANATATSVANLIDDTGYIPNVIVNVGINGDTANLGMNIAGGGSNNTIFRLDTSDPTNYTTQNDLRPYTDILRAYDMTIHDYAKLTVDRPGAVWNIQSLRVGGQTAQTFADALVDVKVEEIASSSPVRSELGGDPHITTWKNEHYEYHGQCDLVMLKDPTFANGLGLDIHIRTKIVRYWSYIKTVAIRIGDDILEIEGSADADDAEAHYWINFEYQGELETLAGFPVTQKLPSPYKRFYIIDLSPKYPGQSIIVQLHKEFVRVKMNGKEEAFGNSVGLMGDFHTGKTLARDGSTVMDDFDELGDEWQILPSDPKLFHEISKPQFPDPCIKPEDPRGERQRRLAESEITAEEAEAACASLKDPLAIKDCVYDVIATQDLDMVGAF